VGTHPRPWSTERTPEPLILTHIDGDPRRGARPPGQGPPVDRPEIEARLGILEDVARALHEAHGAGIVHRDIKPGNIMILNGPKAGSPAVPRSVILDFGLARDGTGDLSTLTQDGDVFGTPYYMAPEQIEGHPVDPRTDVYALGVTLFEVLTGTTPFRAPTRSALYRQVLESPAPDPRSLNPAVSRDLAVVVGTALAKEPARRYQTALDLADDIRRVRLREPIRARPPTLWQRTWSWMQRRPAAAALVTLLILAVPGLAAAAGYIWATLPTLRASEELARHEHVERRLERAFLLGGMDEGVAEEVFLDILEDRPDNLEAAFGRIFIVLRREPARALGLLRQFPESHRRLAAFHLLEAAALERLGETERAAQIKNDAPAPSTALDEFLVGFVALESCIARNRDAAREAFEHSRNAVIAATRARPLYHYQLAITAFLVGDEPTMASCSRHLVQLWPNDATAWFYRGFLLVQPRLGDGEVDHRSMMMEFEVRIRREHIDEAEQCYRRAIELDPSHFFAIHNLGLLLFAKGERQEAEATLRRAAIGCRFASPSYNLGMLLDRCGDMEGAKKALREALEIDPTHLRSSIHLGDVLRRAGERDAAAQHFAAALLLHPDCPELHLGLGVCHLESKEAAVAAACFQKALELRPEYGLAWNNLAAAWAMQGKNEEVVDALRRGVTAAPNHLLLRKNLARALSKLGQHGEAVPHLAKMCELGPPQAPGPLLALADAQSRSGDEEAAASTLERLLSSLPEDAPERVRAKKLLRELR
jgi:tetratricopeptide (TPR) repeat protein